MEEYPDVTMLKLYPPLKIGERSRKMAASYCFVAAQHEHVVDRVVVGINGGARTNWERAEEVHPGGPPKLIRIFNSNPSVFRHLLQFCP